MCTKEERDKRIREMMSRKSEKVVEKMNSTLEKIEIKSSLVPERIFNSYGILDSNLCPQIAKGEKYIKSLEPNVESAIKNYTGCGYVTINGGLRRSRSIRGDEFKYMISRIDIAFRNAPPLEVSMTAYRGVGNIDELRDDSGFSSCSLRKAVSNSFGGGNVFTITIPAGSRVLFVKPISMVPIEDEVLIDRGGMFRELVPGKLIYVSQLTYDEE
jgi:hypothetical protein